MGMPGNRRIGIRPGDMRVIIAGASRIRAGAAAMLLMSALPGGPAHAQAQYPQRPIQIVVPYPPGGSNDVFARAIGPRLASAWDQPVLIDNRPGAGGSVGAGIVAKAASDGYTLMLVSSSFTTNAAVQARLPFDPVKDFSPVALVGKGPPVLTVGNALPVRSVAELLALARQQAGELNYASSGPGSINQFAAELFKAAAHVQITHVPYKGMGPATNDLLGGHVQVLFASAPSIMPQVRAGKVRALAVTSPRPSPVVPGLPAIGEAGVPGYSCELWWGMLAPAGTPPQIVERLNTEINRMLATDEMQQFLLREGAQSAALRPAEVATLVRDEISGWRKIARDAGIAEE
jgi:tripartite-type tricarboxylate transporter receptor subunit TctC